MGELFYSILFFPSLISSNSTHFFRQGAQVAGIAGHELKGKLRRITGLDPAGISYNVCLILPFKLLTFGTIPGPGFRFLDNEFRLDKSDAEFVDVFHTAAGTRLFTGGHFSIFDALGHVDVYFNGGERQAGCPRHRSYSFESNSIIT